MNIPLEWAISPAIGKMADKKSTFNYYLVVPFINFSTRKKDSFFTYKSRQKDLEKSLVEISFGRKKINGLVFGKTSKPPFAVKEISRIIEKNIWIKNNCFWQKKLPTSI